jgi:Holliday junction DNA helicase RuvA
MMTRIAGLLARVAEDEVRLQVGPIEYQVLVPDLVRRALQLKVGEEVVLHTLHYFEGNPTKGGRMTPRLVGFQNEAEIEFFDLFCTVDGIGVKTALKASVRPIKEIAGMIQRQDVAGLATLPGVSTSTAERIVAKLRKKVAKFALMAYGAEPTPAVVEPTVMEEAFLALVSVGHQEAEARRLIDSVLVGGKKFKTAEELLLAVFQRQ